MPLPIETKVDEVKEETKTANTETIAVQFPFQLMQDLVMQLPDDKKVELLDFLQKDLEERKVILARRNLEQLWKGKDGNLYSAKEPDIEWVDVEKEASPEGEEIEMTDIELIEALKNM
ncbi:MAG: hypothetical protein AB8B69_10850 [Chitinophagales bacterium]